MPGRTSAAGAAWQPGLVGVGGYDRPVTTTSSQSGYTARHLSVLEGLEAVRKRPGMYIGTTDSRGLMHCLWEIIDNSVDEALAGYGDRIDIVLHADGSVEVRDNGRGVPVDVEPKTGLTGVEVVYTKLHAGGKFGGGSYGASGGLHGVGASVVNALSSRLDVEVDRNGRTHRMTFRRGEPGDVRRPRRHRPGLGVRAVRVRLGAGAGRQGRSREDRDARAVLGGPADLPQDGGVRLRRARHPGASDELPGAGPDPHGPRRAPASPVRPVPTARTRRRSCTAAASWTSSSTSRRTLRSPTRGA